MLEWEMMLMTKCNHGQKHTMGDPIYASLYIVFLSGAF
jgi:hypothetical protein